MIAGRPAPTTVVGVYRPVDPAEAYWGRSGYFSPTAPDTTAEPVFTGRPTVDALEHDSDNRSIEAIPGPGAFDEDHLAALSTALDRVTEDLGSDDETSRFVALTNDLPKLFERVRRSDELTRELVPLAGLPLIGLCWLVIFVAVAGATAARRHEQALIALRGAPRIGRFWLAAGESVIAIAVGAPLGYLAGTLATRAVADARFGPIPVFDLTPAPGALVAALVAVAGAVVVGLLALRRDLASPVVDLLRRVPPRGAAWRTVAIDAGAVVLAVLAAVQLRAFDGQLLGLGLLVPGLIGAGDRGARGPAAGAAGGPARPSGDAARPARAGARRPAGRPPARQPAAVRAARGRGRGARFRHHRRRRRRPGPRRPGRRGRPAPSGRFRSHRPTPARCGPRCGRSTRTGGSRWRSASGPSWTVRRCCSPTPPRCPRWRSGDRNTATARPPRSPPRCAHRPTSRSSSRAWMWH